MNRDVYDIITAQTVYPLDVYTKLHNLAQIGLGDISVSVVSADNIKKCGKYIVYGNEYTNGVILMFWYMKIYLPSVNSYL